MEIISNNKTAVNTVEVEFKASAEQFEAEVQAVYLKEKKNITVPGFRKGKAPRKVIETQYGEGVFYQDAVNNMYQKVLSEVIDELKLDVVDVPNIEVTDVNKETGVSFKATFTTKPEVEISGYKGLKTVKDVKTVTDEDIDAEIKKLLERDARIVDVTDRALEKGDTAVFDFEGFVDDVAFEGGKADNFSLEIGSGQFIPGFEDQMIGKKIDEEFDVNVTFPEDYHAEELKGKPAVFKCKLHEIKTKEYAEVDDEFAKDVSEFDTLAELKADIRAKLEENANNTAMHNMDTDLTNQVVSLMKAEVPQAMYDSRIDDLIREQDYRFRSQGLSLADYLKFTGSTIEQMRESMKSIAEMQVNFRLALEKIAELENIEVTDEEVEKEYAEMAENYKMELDKVKTLVAADALNKDLQVEKAFDLVRDSAEVTESKE